SITGGQQAQRGLNTSVSQRSQGRSRTEVDVVGVGGEGQHSAQSQALNQRLGVLQPVQRHTGLGLRVGCSGHQSAYIPARVTSICCCSPSRSTVSVMVSPLPYSRT